MHRTFLHKSHLPTSAEFQLLLVRQQSDSNLTSLQILHNLIQSRSILTASLVLPKAGSTRQELDACSPVWSMFPQNTARSFKELGGSSAVTVSSRQCVVRILQQRTALLAFLTEVLLDQLCLGQCDLFGFRSRPSLYSQKHGFTSAAESYSSLLLHCRQRAGRAEHTGVLSS